MDIKIAKKIMGSNFIGPEELKAISGKINLAADFDFGALPVIPFSQEQLKKIALSHILILGIPRNAGGEQLTLNNLRAFFGVDPKGKEPCFYNQDWYLKEKFAQTVLEFKWHLIAKQVKATSRAKRPEEIISSLQSGERFPAAILATFTFFAYYFLNHGEILWRHDFIWCSDMDRNGDRIYIGRYEDPEKINKNGFNIHRHLSIRPCYGAVLETT